MRPDERAVVDQALHRARLSAYAPGEFVGQESFMSASEIRSIASRAGIAPGVSVLDLCCGVAGPGRLVSRELGCAYLGVDASSSAIRLARERAGGSGRFEVARVPPVPGGPFDVVLLLETMLAFADKELLLREVSSALRVGGHFAFTLEEGQPLTATERRRMPAADTVWLTPLPDLVSALARVGMRVCWYDEWSRSHLATVGSLVEGFTGDAYEIRRRLGDGAFEELVVAHRLWGDWLRDGRVRKFAFVVEKVQLP